MINKCKTLGLFLGVLGVLSLSQSASATTFRQLGAKSLAHASQSPNSFGFKGKVLKIENSNDYQKVTFQVQEALKGKAIGENKDKTVTLNFRRPVKLHVQGWPQQTPPQFQQNEESVVFVTRNLRGDDFFIGGEDQARFHVKKEGNRTLIWNNLGNRNLVDTRSENTLVRQIVQDMKARNEGTLDYNDFKKLLNQ